MEFFASFYKFYNMGKKIVGKKSNQAKNLKFVLFYFGIFFKST